MPWKIHKYSRPVACRVCESYINNSLERWFLKTLWPYAGCTSYRWIFYKRFIGIEQSTENTVKSDELYSLFVLFQRFRCGICWSAGSRSLNWQTGRMLGSHATGFLWQMDNSKPYKYWTVPSEFVRDGQIFIRFLRCPLGSYANHPSLVNWSVYHPCFALLGETRWSLPIVIGSDDLVSQWSEKQGWSTDYVDNEGWLINWIFPVRVWLSPYSNRNTSFHQFPA